MWIARSSWLLATVVAALVALAIVIANKHDDAAPSTVIADRVADGHLALADAYFETGDFSHAEREYQAVSGNWYALYKLGWIDFNLQRLQAASGKFRRVAQAATNEPLRRASENDFARVYAEIGEPDQALATFQRIDANDAIDMLELLADVYLSQGKSKQAILTFEKLMQIAPTDRNVCLWQYNIAHAALWSGGNAEAVAQIENLVHLWVALDAKRVLPPADLKDCHDNAAAMTGELARAYHAESAKTKALDTVAFSAKLYELYLDAFRDADDFGETQYWYAELLWARAESEHRAEAWTKAAAAFSAVVTTGKAELKLIDESRYAAVLARKNALRP